MSTRTLLVSVGLVGILCGGAHSQHVPQPPPPGPAYDLPPLPPLPTGSSPRVPPSSPAPVVPTPPAEKSVDDLLGELERVHAQKSELDKKEQELKATLRKKLAQQTERLNKLGVAPKAAQPDRVGRIIIGGNTNTPDKDILDALAQVPGQVLDDSLIEAARVKLEKAGFRTVTVEVIPCNPDPTFKDIRVRVTETDAHRRALPTVK